jgi:hypothetical protein
MKGLKKFLWKTNRTGQRTLNPTRRYALLAGVVLIAGLVGIVTVHAEEGGPVPFRFSLVPASDTIATCLPNASGTVTVFPKEDERGVDTLDLKAEGLPRNTTFAVFLTELPGAPFGAAEYIAEFTTNAAGRGSVRIDATIDEAFSTTVVNGVRVRQDLNHIVLWFADPSADDFCFAPGTGPVTPFDGDGQAGGTALSSRNFLPAAPLP